MATVRHPKASAFVQQRLFAGLSTFAELEQRIANLPDEKSRGDALEVFAEAYLATQRKHDAETVWPLAAVPVEVLASLQLTVQDFGVDGVLQTRLGTFSAYQVKFRAGRPALTWRELSTFMALADSPNIRSRILLTNCDELPPVLNDRRRFFCIRGSDLDRLETEDFKTIEAWLTDSAHQAPRKTPLPHQSEALGKILPAFKEHDRLSAIMACGTGKTLVALWVAENVARASTPAGSRGVSPPVGEHAPGRCLNPQPGTAAPRILVLLPSLALLRQTLHEWLRETSFPSLAYLCVCSDPTVKEGTDALVTAQSDLDFEVSTEPASVRAFLDADFAGVKIIFSTYQSAAVVGQALKGGEMFDLGIFDEAHKTAGREGRNFAFALEDAYLPIRKRLFLTATPRHYNALNKNKEGEAQLVFSMDNQEVYGPQTFRLTFADAANRKPPIICRYKVVISVITSQQVTNELLSRGEVLVNGDAIRARQVANQIALKDAIEKYSVNKVFTFHSTVASAESFTSRGNEGVATHLSEFKSLHVNGAMPTAKRERVMREFRECRRGVISNARCLTEGVDVPAVDMVAFLAPRRSRVDIVQATGRAMRKAEGKTIGYVLVPLYVEQAANETVEQAVLRSDFSEVWEVLQSLQEQDEVLAEIIRDMRMERGRTKGYDDSRFREHVAVSGPCVSLEVLRRSIMAACLEAIGESWFESYGQLVAYQKEHGNCEVPARWPANQKLATWAVGQRQARKLGELSDEKIQKLGQIGFTWNPLDNLWDEYLAKLTAFKRQHGHSNPSQLLKEYKGLGAWVTKQRLLRADGLLSVERIAQLEAAGMVWSPRDEAWQRMFSKLKEYHAAHGHCNVSRGDEGQHKLADWLTRQRVLRSQDRLDTNRMHLLTDLGVDWNPESSAWEVMYQSLLEFYKEHKHFRVPQLWPQNPSLPTWMVNQRRLNKRKALSKDRINRLNHIGFPWNPKKRARLACEPQTNMEWEAFFRQLIQFKARSGHCNVPRDWPRNPALGNWLAMQRWRKKKGKLDADKQRRLDEEGVQWSIERVRLAPKPAANWMARYEQLLGFKRRHRHCNISLNQLKDRGLAGWVNRQRHAQKIGKLLPERERMLNEIGFAWSGVIK